MYILVTEPESDEARRAFNALDDTFGAEPFDKKSAEQVLTEHGFNKSMFDQLLSGEHISEV